MLTTELNTLKTNLAVFYARLSNENTRFHSYGIEKCPDKEQMSKELLLYQFNLTYWQQYQDGTPVPNVNYITLEEFNIMVDRIKLLIES